MKRIKSITVLLLLSAGLFLPKADIKADCDTSGALWFCNYYANGKKCEKTWDMATNPDRNKCRGSSTQTQT